MPRTSADNAFLSAALDYRQRGWSVIPIEPRGKKPLLDWKPFQTRRATKAEIREWFRHEGNIGVVTGRVSGIIVLDVDGDEGAATLAKLAPLPRTLRSSTGRGEHYWFKHPAVIVRNFVKKVPGLDLRGDGGYVVVPPSTHVSGTAYRWMVAPDDSKLAEAPDWVLELVAAPATPSRPETSREGAIEWGERNDRLVRLAGAMRRQGCTPEAILQTLLAENTARCKPPLSSNEIEDIVRSVSAYSPAPSEPEHLTDLGNAQRLVQLHGNDLRYCRAKNEWLIWDGTRWAWDETSEVERRAKRTVRSLYGEAARIDDSEKRLAFAKRAVYSESQSRIAGMIALAKSEPGIPVTAEQLDRDPWLLNVLNGTLDLRTGKLREHQREDLITKLAPVKYDRSTCPAWLKFLDRIMASDEELIAFLQRAIGYSLTGQTREQCLFIMYGTGANGKSTFLSTITALLGDYAQTAATDTFMVRRSEAPRNDVARLKGARFVSAAEAEDGRQFNEALIKQMTGGDRLSARFLYGEIFEFQPTFKLWLAVNHKPTIKGTDNAIWRRIMLIPFKVTIPEDEQDKTLPETLRRELSGILSWAVDGCLEWQRGGLQPPEVVLAATNEYRSEMDMLEQFLAERCVIATTAQERRRMRVTVAELYDAYEAWCDNVGVRYPLMRNTLSTRLKDRGFRTKKLQGEWVWLGISLCGHDGPTGL